MRLFIGVRKLLIAIFFLSFTSMANAAAVCGLYQVEDFGDRILFSLIKFLPEVGATKTYTIQNPLDPLVQGMVASQCYCVRGRVSADPDFGRDPMFRRLVVENVTKGPYIGCRPLDADEHEH